MLSPRRGWTFTALPLPDPEPGVLSLSGACESEEVRRLVDEMGQLTETANDYRAYLAEREGRETQECANVLRALEMCELEIIALHRRIMPALVSNRGRGNARAG